jgi:hypothetical protein
MVRGGDDAGITSSLEMLSQLKETSKRQPTIAREESAVVTSRRRATAAFLRDFASISPASASSVSVAAAKAESVSRLSLKFSAASNLAFAACTINYPSWWKIYLVSVFAEEKK